VGQGTLRHPDEMRQSVPGYVCDAELVSWDAAGEAFLVTVRFSEPESERCPRDLVGATAPVLFRWSTASSRGSQRDRSSPRADGHSD
jgi:hypothetical protein